MVVDVSKAENRPGMVKTDTSPPSSASRISLYSHLEYSRLSAVTWTINRLGRAEEVTGMQGGHTLIVSMTLDKNEKFQTGR